MFPWIDFLNLLLRMASVCEAGAAAVEQLVRLELLERCLVSLRQQENPQAGWRVIEFINYCIYLFIFFRWSRLEQPSMVYWRGL